MHSFYELSKHLGNGPFILTTVDTIFREEEFSDYVRTFQRSTADGYDGLMGVTDYIDDEKPLYVGTDAAMNITDSMMNPRAIIRMMVLSTSPVEFMVSLINQSPP